MAKNAGLVLEGRPIEVDGETYLRFPIKTRIITADDDIAEVAYEYTRDIAQEGDIIFVSEKATAATQGRAIPVDQIHPSWLARFLSSKVKKVNYGVGLTSPYSMQMAIREVGVIRILIAAAVSAITKLFGLSGWFYRVAGMQAALVDGASPENIPPYDKTVVLGPLHPEREAHRIKDRTGLEAAIVDVNDIGGSWVIGASDGVDKRKLEKILCDNPLSQGHAGTPIGLVRLASEGELVRAESAPGKGE